MRFVFASVFATLLLLSGIAALWRPRDTDDRIPMVWATDDAPVRREQIALFNKLHPAYHLTLDPVSGPGDMEKIIVQSLAGAGPDIFDCYSQFQLALYVRSGIALNLTDALAGRDIHKEDAWECLWPLVELDGNLYGFPGNSSGPAMWFNKRIFREAGLPYPDPDWTWDECIAIARKLTRRDRQGRPVQFVLMLDIREWRTVLLAQYGGNIYTPEGTRCTLDAPEACAAAQAYQDLMFRHGVSPNYAEDVALASTGGWGIGVITRFGAGLGAMAMGGRWWLCILRDPSYRNLELGVRRHHHHGDLDDDGRRQHAALPGGNLGHPGGALRSGRDRRGGPLCEVPLRHLAATGPHHFLHRDHGLHCRTPGRIRAGPRTHLGRPRQHHHDLVLLHLHQGLRGVPDRLCLGGWPGCSFCLTIPPSLDEAATIDGASDWQIYWDIIMPLARPGLIVLAIFTFMGNYGSFFWPLVLIKSEHLRTLPIGMLYFDTVYGKQTNLIMAASVMNILPLIVLFATIQKYLVKGIQLGAVKG